LGSAYDWLEFINVEALIGYGYTESLGKDLRREGSRRGQLVPSSP